MKNLTNGRQPKNLAKPTPHFLHDNQRTPHEQTWPHLPAQPAFTPPLTQDRCLCAAKLDAASDSPTTTLPIWDSPTRRMG